MMERPTFPLEGSLMHFLLRGEGYTVVDTSFLSTCWNRTNEGEEHETKEQLNQRLNNISRFYDLFSEHADSGVTIPRETYDEFTKAKINLGRQIKRMMRIHYENRFGRSSQGIAPERVRQLQECANLHKSIKLKNDNFRRSELGCRLVEPILEIKNLEDIAENLKIVVNESLEDNPPSEPIGANDCAIYAKALALSYLAPISILTRDNDFISLINRYTRQRFTAVNQRGLPDFPNVPRVIHLNGDGAWIYDAYQSPPTQPSYYFSTEARKIRVVPAFALSEN